MSVSIYNSMVEVLIGFFYQGPTQFYISLSHCLDSYSVGIIIEHTSLDDIGIHLHHLLGWVVLQQLGKCQLKDLGLNC